MIDIVERLRFDSARCELQFSKGVAGNIDEAADEIERLRTRIAEMSALARSVRERVDVLIQMEIDTAGREALAAHL